ncbi:MAG: hypothetical protein A2091_02765 [Desulfuromonadales bacterium GWD2_61_12]|nr:MAG: hypothetical protein A2091_02765 [Desulfuromonadales bacterium GWD2_61_12]HAD04318.1 hypothetical protein [Desulfuromonas sp.]HBT82709.1 hypothetical protein [Desulfuromonas sp.]
MTLAAIIVVSTLLLVIGCMKPAVSPGMGKATATFVGSEACKDCHAEAFASWQDSWHSKIVRPAKGSFLREAVEKWASDGTNAGPAVGNVNGKAFKREDVQYVVGSRWKQRYLVQNDETGNLQFMNMQFNRGSGMWEKYGQKNDWNTQCATCHTTGYRITAIDEMSGKTLKSEFSELSVGCEACHGPGSAHVASKHKLDIFNPANVGIMEQSKVCGYCHIRLENELWKTAQGNPREDFPAPVLGKSYIAGDDWTKWYPHEAVIPGVHAEDPFDKEYVGDLKGLFKLDEHAKSTGVFEEAKHHQEYQGFIQSAHFKSGKISCITCHSPHAGMGKIKKVAKQACGSCHDASYTMEKYMPNTGQTAGNLFVRSHTFNATPRQGGAGAESMGPPNYYGD